MKKVAQLVKINLPKNLVLIYILLICPLFLQNTVLNPLDLNFSDYFQS